MKKNGSSGFVKWLKRIGLALLALLLLLVLLFAGAAQAAGGLKWARSLKDAMAQAKERGSMIFICEAVSNEPSNDAQIEALSDPAFIKAARNSRGWFAFR